MIEVGFVCGAADGMPHTLQPLRSASHVTVLNRKSASALPDKTLSKTSVVGRSVPAGEQAIESPQWFLGPINYRVLALDTTNINPLKSAAFDPNPSSHQPTMPVSI